MAPGSVEEVLSDRAKFLPGHFLEVFVDDLSGAIDIDVDIVVVVVAVDDVLESRGLNKIIRKQ